MHETSIAIIGCGSLGTAVLQGLLIANVKPDAELKISTVIATVTAESSKQRLGRALDGYPDNTSVKIYAGDHAAAVRASEVIILACPPDAMHELLSQQDMRDAFREKTLISVLAGVTRVEMEEALYGSATLADGDSDRCWVFRALPNLAVSLGSSATAVEVSNPRPPEAKSQLVDMIFESLGGITHVPAKKMDAATVLCGSTPAFFALFLDGVVDGAVAAGVPRTIARSMAAQALGSTAALLMAGEGKSPSALREEICAMPGCTILGSVLLEQGGVRYAASRALKESIDAASGLGKK